MKKNIIILILLSFLSLYFLINKCLDYNKNKYYNQWINTAFWIIMKKAKTCEKIEIKDNNGNSIKLINIKCKNSR